MDIIDKFSIANFRETAKVSFNQMLSHEEVERTGEGWLHRRTIHIRFICSHMTKR